MEEVWKDIKGFEGKFSISNLGRVKSLARKKNHPLYKKVHIMPELIMTNVKINNYLGIRIGGKGFLIHRLIAIAFIQNPLNKPQVNHINCDKTDNSLSNLEWVTQKENSDHAIKNGRQEYLFGENMWLNRLKKSDVLRIRSMGIYGMKNNKRIFMNAKKLAEIFDAPLSTINDVLHRRTWKWL